MNNRQHMLNYIDDISNITHYFSWIVETIVYLNLFPNPLLCADVLANAIRLNATSTGEIEYIYHELAGDEEQ